MQNLNLIVVCLLLAGGALFIVSVINARQTRHRLINQKIQQQKRKLIELEELAADLESLTGNVKIARIVTEEIVDTIKGMLQLAPDSQSLELSLHNTQTRLEEISSPAYQCRLHRLFESDAAIAHKQYLLGEAGRIIRKRQAQGHIELAEMTGHIAELAWAHLMVSVVSLTAHGHKAVNRGDILKAHAFYKKARECAIASSISDERRHQWIKELSEIMGGKRKSVSTTLMPEAQFNPDDAVQEAL